MATISVLGHEIYAQLHRITPPPNYTHAGFLGITFFVTAFISQVLANRVQQSEALAQLRAVDIEKLAQLNEKIVQHLQSGIVVLDEALRIRLLNESAKNLLGADENMDALPIDDLFPELADSAQNWKAGSGEQTVIVKSARTDIDIQASFVSLSVTKKFELLIFLDDVSVLRQRAQQMKLASLGRLTASIAHEVRNPLGAISHAGQLLSESTSLDQEDKRLTTIINEHSQRVNNIIENIMSISRRQKAEPVTIELQHWLEGFIRECTARHNLATGSIKLENGSGKVFVRMDPDQLHQILWNLIENGIRYSENTPFIELRYSTKEDSQRTYIDVIDHGSGMSPNTEEQLFEPFFTTSIKGSGLGLYIASELCEANQATLSLHENTTAGCCFRILFSRPEKQID